MRLFSLAVAPLALLVSAPTLAQSPYWQCAAFARQFSGIEIRGDAWTWWQLAEGRYAKGSRPSVGAVLSFTPSRSMRLGHVATVTRIVDRREIAVTHANWSPIGGVRGQIERDVLIRDVSDDNDWSRVRVWYAPIGQLGTTAWPVDGFIYNEKVPRLAKPLQVAAVSKVPRLAYARLDTLAVDAPAPRGLRLGGEIIRLALLEDRPPR